jgi:hypothetical protein
MGHQQQAPMFTPSQNYQHQPKPFVPQAPQMNSQQFIPQQQQ